MNRPLGCLTTTGITAAILTAALITVAAVISGQAIFSPGDLNAERGSTPLGGIYAHADLSQDCAQCHAPFWSVESMGDRCLECHVNIQLELAFEASFHYGFADASNCLLCHTDHHGGGGRLTRAEMESFPHDRVGFSLAAHEAIARDGRFTCGDCHTLALGSFDTNVCRACHESYEAAFMEMHVHDFSPTCLGCHDGLETLGSSFDHRKASFPLVGQHSQIECGSCHAGAQDIEALLGTESDCAGCHLADSVHPQGYSTECGTCHRPTSWTDVTFDHAQSAFPLTGAHVSLSCDLCHQGGMFGETPTRCAACHLKDDSHQGQFGDDCGACHTTNSWSEATFDHNLSRFPLTGAHLNTPCLQCHVGNRYAGTGTSCVSCHADPPLHAGLFGTDCALCHSTNAWRPATYNGPHTFPVNHGGAGAACATCHPYAFSAYTCYSCHEHSQAEIEHKHREEVRGDFSNCVACHPTGRKE